MPAGCAENRGKHTSYQTPERLHPATDGSWYRVPQANISGGELGKSSEGWGERVSRTRRVTDTTRANWNVK